MATNNMTYKHGKIYCIRNTVDDDIYVGSTTQLVCKIMVHHPSHMHRHIQMKLYTKMRELGVEHFYIELVEKGACESKADLCKREGYFIRAMATLNGKVMGRTHKEYYE
jgi:predicted GIY-YIG superfamily endonuclease